MVLNVSKWSGTFPDGLEHFQMAWNVSRWPVKFPDGLETFYFIQKLSRFTNTFLVALLPCYLSFYASGVRNNVMTYSSIKTCLLTWLLVDRCQISPLEFPNSLNRGIKELQCSCDKHRVRLSPPQLTVGHIISNRSL